MHRVSGLRAVLLLALVLVCLLSPSLSFTPPSSSSELSALDSTNAHGEQGEQQQAVQPQQQAAASLHRLPTLTTKDEDVVTGDDLRHPRDPKQQRKQQAEVLRHGQQAKGSEQQTDERREDEADSAQRAGAKAARSDVLVSNASAVSNSSRGGSNRTQQQSVPFGSDPQARTFSHQQQPPVLGSNASSVQPPPYTPGEYNRSAPLAYPQPVPSEQHAQGQVQQGEGQQGQARRDVIDDGEEDDNAASSSDDQQEQQEQQGAGRDAAAGAAQRQAGPRQRGGALRLSSSSRLSPRRRR